MGDAGDESERQELTTVYIGEGKREKAIDELLEVLCREREWNDREAKEQLCKIFDSLGPTDEMAKAGRGKLSSMIFA